MHRSLGILLALALSSCGGSGRSETSATPDGVATAQPREPLIVVDVRTPDEYASGHVKGARLIDFREADFDARIATLPKDTAIVLYCRSGNRSGQALSRLKELGYTKVRHVEGGISNWSDPTRPIEY